MSTSNRSPFWSSHLARRRSPRYALGGSTRAGGARYLSSAAATQRPRSSRVSRHSARRRRPQRDRPARKDHRRDDQTRADDRHHAAREGGGHAREDTRRTCRRQRRAHDRGGLRERERRSRCAERPAHLTRANGPAHVKAIVVGNSVALPIRDGEIELGTWQGLWFAELDGPRERTATITV